MDFDLDLGMEEVTRKDEDKQRDERLGEVNFYSVFRTIFDLFLLAVNLHRWISLNPQKFRLASDIKEGATLTSLNTDFVCYRGLLTTVMCAPYENRNDLLVLATK